MTEIKLFFVQTSSSRLYIVLILFSCSLIHSLIHSFIHSYIDSCMRLLSLFPTVFAIVGITFFSLSLLHVRVFSLFSMCVLSSDYSAKPCLNFFIGNNCKEQPGIFYSSFKHGESVVFLLLLLFCAAMIIEFVHCHFFLLVC